MAHRSVRPSSVKFSNDISSEAVGPILQVHITQIASTGVENEKLIMFYVRIG